MPPGGTNNRRRNAARLRQDLAALRDAMDLHRTRNGRPAINWMSRRTLPRWRMVPLNGQWYERGRLARAVTQSPSVPHSRRRLTPAELRNATNTEPYSLAPWRFG